MIETFVFLNTNLISNSLTLDLEKPNGIGKDGRRRSKVGESLKKSKNGEKGSKNGERGSKNGERGSKNDKGRIRSALSRYV